VSAATTPALAGPGPPRSTPPGCARDSPTLPGCFALPCHSFPSNDPPVRLNGVASLEFPIDRAEARAYGSNADASAVPWNWPMLGRLSCGRRLGRGRGGRRAGSLCRGGRRRNVRFLVRFDRPAAGGRGLGLERRRGKLQGKRIGRQWGLRHGRRRRWRRDGGHSSRGRIGHRRPACPPRGHQQGRQQDCHHSGTSMVQLILRPSRPAMPAVTRRARLVARTVASLPSLCITHARMVIPSIAAPIATAP